MFMTLANFLYAAGDIRKFVAVNNRNQGKENQCHRTNAKGICEESSGIPNFCFDNKCVSRQSNNESDVFIAERRQQLLK